MRRLVIPLLGCFLSVASHAYGQNDAIATHSKAEHANPPAYEVVSIRQVKGELGSGGIGDLPDGFWMKNLLLVSLISSAYGEIRDDEISGWPKWATSVRFDLDAKMDTATADALKRLPKEQQEAQRQLMLQSLLEERFRLKVHRATEVRQGYELIVAKGGLKMKENHQATDMAGNKWQEGRTPVTDWFISDGRISGHAMPISILASHLEGAVDSTVMNKTGLTERYDVALHWDRSNQQRENPNEPSLFTALEEQLGLRLKSTKTEVGTIVIDRLEMPSPN